MINFLPIALVAQHHIDSYFKDGRLHENINYKLCEELKNLLWDDAARHT